MLEYKEINNYKYVSFDLFDTLIFRSFSNYKKIFEFVAYKYNLNNTNPISQYAKNRIKAEKKARKKAGFKEITIDDIYNELPYELSICEALKELEKEIEVKSSMPNKEIIALLNSLYDAGKKIIITTDM